jgi:hypothetical protein
MFASNFLFDFAGTLRDFTRYGGQCSALAHSIGLSGFHPTSQSRLRRNARLVVIPLLAVFTAMPARLLFSIHGPAQRGPGHQ